MSGTVIESGTRALRLRVKGLVQGVGFRPFVHRLALRHGLGGWVRNASGEVQIAIEGPVEQLDAFLLALRRDAPLLARIEAVAVESLDPSGTSQFTILPSSDDPDGRQPVSADVAACDACLAEMFDASDRRYRYPFITCTDCGPRFTVIEAMPYDRERTSMRAFNQCAACRSEYQSPGHRRFHSETNSCPACGPQVWLEGPGNARLDRGDALRAAADLLKGGWVVALRGLGGFHLAADATDEAAVERLRERKHRDAKPFAVMVRTLDDARGLGHVGECEGAALASPERPIVLLERHPDARLALAVAPGLSTIGVMLAYTPLHHLLLDLTARPLVMTSGNRSDEPIAVDNEDARERLRWIADAFLMHDRGIVSRYDDSVLRFAGERPVFLRRARGYAPTPVELPARSPLPLLAVGGQLKSAFALVHEQRAWVSQHIGDLDDADALEQFLETLRRYRTLFRIEPRVAVRDLHPDYLSTRLADDLGVSRVLTVQHHHAHIAAVMAEHAVTGPVIGVAYDGAGYGEDGATWGAETLVATITGYRRVAQLRYAPLPGGDLAARRPWRAALGYLSLDPGLDRAFCRAFVGVDRRELDLARQQIQHHLNASLASSMGRLFDAAAAVLGVRRVSAYEGQAAMELESLAGRAPAPALPFPFSEENGALVMDPLPLLAALGERRAAGQPVEDLAAAFHEGVANTTADIVTRIARSEELDTVALGGGVFQNARLVSSVRRRLEERGLRVLQARRLPPNDGGLCYGQAAVAIARLRQETGG